MSSAKPLILLEFNELCPDLIERWIASGDLPNFAKLKQQTHNMITSADAEVPALEPWIQWYSLHTGKPYAEHQVFSLTDGQSQTDEDIWEALNKVGVSTFNCGSMNAKARYADNHIYIPDPWCTKHPTGPAELSVYHKFVSKQVINQANTDSFTSKLKENFEFVTFMLKHGLSLQTIKKIAKQLWSEKTVSTDLYWKRAVILDWLQLDLFKHIFKHEQPQFSTFFLNSTAHLQHSYWRFLEPDKFDLDTNSKDYEKYKDAVLFGYKNMDALIGEFLQLSERYNVDIALATALSQQAFVSEKKAQVFYKLKDIKSFVEMSQIAAKPVLPVMTHQYIFAPNKAEKADQFVAFLEGVTFEDGQRLFDYRVRDDGSIYFGTLLRRNVDDHELVRIPNQSKAFTFGELFNLINESKSGAHHPDGLFWLGKNQGAKTDTNRIPLIEAYNLVLNNFKT